MDKNNLVDCSKAKSFPPITFTWKDASVTLTWDQQIIVDMPTKSCMSIFYPGRGTTDDPLILGAQFLRNFYSIFDYGSNSTGARVGLAKPSDSFTMTLPNSSGAVKYSMLAACISIFTILI
ncbi:hypothetical protein HDV04_001946 [Boothiomyces sp. JEL0838]|nr:hypothetical protein HDV04_001946 [Boothiomyces sp. JEL0838]